MKKISYLLFVSLFIFACSNKDTKNSNNNIDPIEALYYSWIKQGKKSIPEIRKALFSKKWRMRSHAALALGKLRDKKFEDKILHIAKTDIKKPVRNCAVIALGQLHSTKSLPYLLKLLNIQNTKYSVNKNYLIKALGEIGNSKAVYPLFKILLSKKNSYKMAATDALVKIKDKKILHLLKQNIFTINKNRSQRFAAIIYGKFMDRSSIPYLLSISKTGDSQLKVTVARALGEIKSPLAITTLIKNIYSKIGLLQKTSADALININSKKSIYPLLKLFYSKEKSVYMTSTYTLTMMNLKKIPNVVFNAFKNSHKINEPSAYLFARKKFRKALPILKQRLSNIKENGQDEMARCFGWMKDKSSVPLLISVAQRKSLIGSIGSIWSLGKIKDKTAVPPLIALLKSNKKSLYPHIILALGNIGDKRAITPLIEKLYETGKLYSKIIGLSLGRIGGPEVIKFIKENLESDDINMQITAGASLIRLKNKSLVDYAIKLLPKSNEKLNKYLMYYLRKSTGNNFKTKKEWLQWYQEKQ